ncbi:MAG: SDR family oxidoreductase [Bacillota bacterium]|nr:SDR family oxidoreductase [Bacillota bacterium]
MSIQGKVAIVTGASRGIGRSIAEQLAELGAKVVVNYSASSEKANEVVEAIVKNRGEALAIKGDISNVGDVKMLFTETIMHFGQVDLLINNAGYMENKLIKDVTETDFDKHFSINVKGTYFGCQQAMNYMEDGGRIINISTSVLGAMLPSYSVYAATKGAVEQITRQLAKEFGPRGITINAIAPGPVRTELFTEGKTEEQIETIANMNAFRRLGEPRDISNVVEFLVSEKSQWITGQTIRVNGGYY